MADTPDTQDPHDQAAPTTPTEGADHSDELKDRFRAALERKRGEAKARSTHGHGAGSAKVGESHRKAGGKRTFRRKSG